MIYGSIYDHGGGAHGNFFKKTLSCEEVPYVEEIATWSLKSVKRMVKSAQSKGYKIYIYIIIIIIIINKVHYKHKWGEIKRMV